jgi:hypothetical protein
MHSRVTAQAGLAISVSAWRTLWRKLLAATTTLAHEPTPPQPLAGAGSATAAGPSGGLELAVLQLEALCQRSWHLCHCRLRQTNMPESVKRPSRRCAAAPHHCQLVGI